ncbi:MAG: hypothetical protein ABIR18_11155 [Chitinophagaceae bacterium]
MKGIAKPSIYFSAYPLKAVEQKATTSNDVSKSPYLRSMLSGRKKIASNVRVFPMINPYREKDAHPDAPPITAISRILDRIPKDAS